MNIWDILLIALLIAIPLAAFSIRRARRRKGCGGCCDGCCGCDGGKK